MNDYLGLCRRDCDKICSRFRFIRVNSRSPGLHVLALRFSSTQIYPLRVSADLAARWRWWPGADGYGKDPKPCEHSDICWDEIMELRFRAVARRAKVVILVVAPRRAGEETPVQTTHTYPRGASFLCAFTPPSLKDYSQTRGEILN